MAEMVKTICQGCYFYCGLDVHVESGRVTNIEGMAEHPVNRGALCPKGLAAGQLVTDERRLKQPLVRAGERGAGKWEPISWDAALDTIAARLLEIKKEEGANRVGYHRGQSPGWVTTLNYVIRFMNSLGSPNIFTHAHLCFKPRAIAHSATYGGVPEIDYERAHCILLWGFNPVYTSLTNYARRIIAAKERGAKLIVIDPLFTNIAAKADLWLQPRPGSDGALALGMAKVIIEEELYDREFVRTWTYGFEELCEFIEAYALDRVESITWVPANRIREAAYLYATTKPAGLKEGNGLDQHTNVVQTVRAVALLPTLTGNLDVPGGNILVPPLPFIDVQRRGAVPEDWEEQSVSAHPLYFRPDRSLNSMELLNSLLTGEPYHIRALIVQGSDPVAVLSNSNKVREILKRLDFIVAHDLYMTATAEIADVVLPAASFLERDLLLYYRYRPGADVNLIAMQNRVVEPVGQSRSDLDLIFAMAKRLGLERHFPWENVLEAFDWELKPNNITVHYLREHPEGYIRKYEPEELYKKYERQGFATPTKKAELYSTRFKKFGYEPLPVLSEPGFDLISRSEAEQEYPLICGTGLKLGIHTHVQFQSLPWLKEIEPHPFVEIHPSMAERLGVEDGDTVVAESAQGVIRLRARTTEAVDPRVVMVAHGWGEPYADGDLDNIITPDNPQNLIAAATSNRSFPCRIRKA